MGDPDTPPAPFAPLTGCAPSLVVLYRDVAATDSVWTLTRGPIKPEDFGTEWFMGPDDEVIDEDLGLDPSVPLIGWAPDDRGSLFRLRGPKGVGFFMWASLMASSTVLFRFCEMSLSSQSMMIVPGPETELRPVSSLKIRSLHTHPRKQFR